MLDLDWIEPPKKPIKKARYSNGYPICNKCPGHPRLNQAAPGQGFCSWCGVVLTLKKGHIR